MSGNNKSGNDLDELKQKSGEFAKAAGGVLDALGKLAKDKGKNIVDTVTDQGMRENAVNSVKDFSSKTVLSVTKVINNDKKESKQIDETSEQTVQKNLDIINPINTSNESLESVDVVIQSDTAVYQDKNNSTISEATVEKNNNNDYTVMKLPDGIETVSDKQQSRSSNVSNEIIIPMGILLLICAIGIAFLMVTGNKDNTNIYPPYGPKDAVKLKYNVVVDAFKEAGFTNVNAEGTDDLSGVETFDAGRVVKVTIEGDDQYTSDKKYSKDSEIIVYYNIQSEGKDEVQDEADESVAAEEQEKTDEDEQKPKEQDGRIDEMAFRAAVVALTNSLAYDVFMDNDGNKHDPSKFYTYSNQSGECALVVIDDGCWKEIGKNKWHVDSLLLENSNGVTIDATLDVKKEGGKYKITNISGRYEKVGLEEYGTDLADATDPRAVDDKALTVPEELIAEDR